jgi:hypothetical protein
MDTISMAVIRLRENLDRIGNQWNRVQKMPDIIQSLTWELNNHLEDQSIATPEITAFNQRYIR